MLWFKDWYWTASVFGFKAFSYNWHFWQPCSNKGCPLGNNIPGFIKAIKEEDYKKAYEILSETTLLESVCGRICPHTKQCEGSCVRGIKSNPVSIGEMEAFIGDISIKENYKISEKNIENQDSGR